MTVSKNLKIAIASASYRAHYVGWFREALESQGIHGEVIALEYRESAPTLAYADRSALLPAYNSPAYRSAVLSWARAESPDLFISLNDYELQILSDGLADDLRELGCTVASLDSYAQMIVLDKHLMAATLNRYGVPTPATWLGSEAEAAKELNPRSEFVVKHRFGSGSTGLEFASAENLHDAVSESAKSAKGIDGRASSDDLAAVIIQEKLPGNEFGVDGVFSMDGTGALRGVLARRKDLMRGGDTDVATTVSPERFAAYVGALAEILRPVGPIDIDFKETAGGDPLIIDINPRFGGGYPFCHLAGADVPADIVRTMVGLKDDPSLLRCRHGVTSARRDGFAVLNESLTALSRAQTKKGTDSGTGQRPGGVQNSA